MNYVYLQTTTQRPKGVHRFRKIMMEIMRYDSHLVYQYTVYDDGKNLEKDVRRAIGKAARRYADYLVTDRILQGQDYVRSAAKGKNILCFDGREIRRYLVPIAMRRMEKNGLLSDKENVFTLDCKNEEDLLYLMEYLQGRTNCFQVIGPIPARALAFCSEHGICLRQTQYADSGVLVVMGSKPCAVGETVRVVRIKNDNLMIDAGINYRPMVMMEKWPTVSFLQMYLHMHFGTDYAAAFEKTPIRVLRPADMQGEASHTCA